MRFKARSPLLLALVIHLSAVTAQASMWAPPDWELMLKETDVIALVEVVEGGPFLAKVRPITVFKGTASKDFYVTDFNNPTSSSHGTKIEPFADGEHHYLFLMRDEQALHAVDFLSETTGGRFQSALRDLALRVELRLPKVRYRAARAAAKDGRLMRLWTPSVGDLPVENDKVRYTLFNPADSTSAPLRDRAELEEFLRAALAFSRDGSADAKRIGAALQKIRAGAAQLAAANEANTEDAPPSELSHDVAAYALMGGTAFDPVFDQIATATDSHARLALARLLGRVADERAGRLLRLMCKDTSSMVHAEVVRQLVKSRAPDVGHVLHEMLSSVDPSSLARAARYELEATQGQLIGALGELRYAPAAPLLLELLGRVESSAVLHALVEALEKIGHRDYAAALAKACLRPELIMSVANLVRDRRLVELKPVFEELAEKIPHGAAGGPHSAVISALGRIGDDGTGARLTRLLETLNARSVPEVFDSGVAGASLEALAELGYAPARAVAEQTFFYWFGVDSAFVQRPELLQVKQRLEREIVREAKKQLHEFWWLDARALVFLKNRHALAQRSTREPEYTFAVHIDVRSSAQAHLDAEALKSRLDRVFAPRQGVASVTRWKKNFGTGSVNGDDRVRSATCSSLFSSYASYMRAICTPEDVRLAKFIVESGLAASWGAKDEFQAVLTSGCGSSPERSEQ